MLHRNHPASANCSIRPGHVWPSCRALADKLSPDQAAQLLQPYTAHKQAGLRAVALGLLERVEERREGGLNNGALGKQQGGRPGLFGSGSSGVALQGQLFAL